MHAGDYLFISPAPQTRTHALLFALCFPRTKLRAAALSLPATRMGCMRGGGLGGVVFFFNYYLFLSLTCTYFFFKFGDRGRVGKGRRVPGPRVVGTGSSRMRSETGGGCTGSRHRAAESTASFWVLSRNGQDTVKPRSSVRFSAAGSIDRSARPFCQLYALPPRAFMGFGRRCSG